MFYWQGMLQQLQELWPWDRGAGSSKAQINFNARHDTLLPSWYTALISVIDLSTEFLDVINAEWVKGFPEKLIL